MLVSRPSACGHSYLSANRGLACPRSVRACVQRRSVLRQCAAVAQPDVKQPLRQPPPGWRFLLDDVVDAVMAYEKAAGREVDADGARDLLQQLAGRLDLYQHLNSKFRSEDSRGCRGRKVDFMYDTSQGKHMPAKQGISFLDCRGAANITHPCPAAMSRRVHQDASQRVPYLAVPRITCASAAADGGLELHWPELPCVAVFQPNWADEGHPQYRPGLPQWSRQDHYKYYPIELCIYEPDGKLPTEPKDIDWPDIAHKLQQPLPAGQQLNVPEWVVLPQPATAASTATASPGVVTNISSDSTSTDSTSSTSTSTSTSTNVSTRHSAWSGRSLSYSAAAQISQGLKEWTSQLNPTKDEQKDMKATMQAVSSVLQAICKNKTWTVQVLPVGSNKKKTSLRGSREIDILVQLHTKAKFEVADFSNKRLACLDLIIHSLDQDRDDPTDLSGGWCEAGSVAHFTHLYHQGLDIHTDIQIAPNLQQLLPDAVNGQCYAELVKLMIRRADNDASIPELSEQLKELSDPRSYDRDPAGRTAVLTTLLSDLLQAVDSTCLKKYGQKGAGDMCRTVIRAMKAWVKEGLKGKLLPHGITDSNSKAARPPGYIWEIVVMHVLQERLRQHRQMFGAAAPQLYSHDRVGELDLFMDVLQEVSQRLGPEAANSSKPAQPIAVTYPLGIYTAKECELFRPCWQREPYIIHSDPSFNCTVHHPFPNKQWRVLAAEAGKLYEKMQQQEDGDAWEAIVEGTTLGPAVKAWPKQSAAPETLQ